jgi:hypothetical protein
MTTTRTFADRLATCDRIKVDDRDMIQELELLAKAVFAGPTALIIDLGDPLADGPQVKGAVNIDGTGRAGAVDGKTSAGRDTFQRHEFNGAWKRLERRVSEMIPDLTARGTVGTYVISLSYPIRFRDVEPGDRLEAVIRGWNEDDGEETSRWTRVQVDRKPWAGNPGQVVVTDGSSVDSVVESSLRVFL